MKVCEVLTQDVDDWECNKPGGLTSSIYWQHGGASTSLCGQQSKHRVVLFAS